MNDLTATQLYYNRNVRHNPDNLIFCCFPHKTVSNELQETEIVFLERGNDNAGLIHILNRHNNDFRNKIGDRSIPDLLKHTITNLQPLNIHNDNKGLALEYAFDERVYPGLIHDTITIAVGNNGFIVSAMPVGLNTALRRIRRDYL